MTISASDPQEGAAAWLNGIIDGVKQGVGSKSSSPATTNVDKSRVSNLSSTIAGSPRKQRLIHAVEKKANSPLGPFEDVNLDLAHFIEKHFQNCTPELKMAYGYARRSAMAGLFFQGVIDEDVLAQVHKIFVSLQNQTGQTVAFQEESAALGSELLQSYVPWLSIERERQLMRFATVKVTARQLVEGGQSNCEITEWHNDWVSIDECFAILESMAPVLAAHEGGRKKMPGANKNNHFYLRDAETEGLSHPIHIHFDSYDPVLKMGTKVLPNPCTFLVTVDSPEFSPRGLTCRVSGINHKRSPDGVRNGVIAHVDMVKQDDDGAIERVHVQLLEDGRVVGQLVRGGKYQEMASLDGVFFVPGDSVFLNGMGDPHDEDNQPRPTREQELFFAREREEMTNSWFDS